MYFIILSFNSQFSCCCCKALISSSFIVLDFLDFLDFSGDVFPVSIVFYDSILGFKGSSSFHAVLITYLRSISFKFSIRGLFSWITLYSSIYARPATPNPNSFYCFYSSMKWLYLRRFTSISTLLRILTLLRYLLHSK